MKPTFFHFLSYQEIPPMGRFGALAHFEIGRKLEK
jgi:hypothetical protein